MGHGDPNTLALCMLCNAVFSIYINFFQDLSESQNSLDSNQDRLDVLKGPNVITKVISRRKSR